MISKSQYETLKLFANGILNIQEIPCDLDILDSLSKEKLITVSSYISTPTCNLITEYCITELGKSKIEEYERTIDLYENEKESVSIAKEANELSRIANSRANISNIISWLAIVISIIAVVTSFFN